MSHGKVILTAQLIMESLNRPADRILNMAVLAAIVRDGKSTDIQRFLPLRAPTFKVLQIGLYVENVTNFLEIFIQKIHIPTALSIINGNNLKTIIIAK